MSINKRGWLQLYRPTRATEVAKGGKQVVGSHPASVAVQAFVKSLHCNSGKYITSLNEGWD
ncbi:hypothetical protein LJR066_003544 [Acidovorax sp. LjRoot66]|uniref:hypothetical protein n=1 Tax=Acidovorax sp. LjRoot66 TaxID=3342334 RepID=UPI003ECF8099